MRRNTVDADKQSPDYLAGRRDLANELAEEARKAKPLTLEEIKRMSPDEINRRWSEVQPVLGGNS
jgi:hypothetical protein